MIIFAYITDIDNSSYDVKISMIFNTMMKKCHLNDHTTGVRSHSAKANAKANFFSQLKFTEFPYLQDVQLKLLRTHLLAMSLSRSDSLSVN